MTPQSLSGQGARRRPWRQPGYQASHRRQSPMLAALLAVLATLVSCSAEPERSSTSSIPEQATASPDLRASGVGLGSWRFGDSSEMVLRGLRNQLGKPDSDTGWEHFLSRHEVWEPVLAMYAAEGLDLPAEEGPSWYRSDDTVGEAWEYPVFRAVCWSALCVTFGGEGEESMAFRGWELSTWSSWDRPREVDASRPTVSLEGSGIRIGSSWNAFESAYPTSLVGGAEGGSLAIDNPPWPGFFDGVANWRLSGDWSAERPHEAPPDATVTRMSAGEGPEPGCC